MPFGPTSLRSTSTTRPRTTWSSRKIALTTSDSKTSSDQLTRTPVAKALGCSVTQVRRLEDDGILNPTIGERSVRHFDAAEVAAVRRDRLGEDPYGGETVERQSEPVDGATSAAVMELLEQGQTPADVVRSKSLPAATVRRVYCDWLDLRALTVDAPDGAKRLATAEERLKKAHHDLAELRLRLDELAPLAWLMEFAQCGCGPPTRQVVPTYCPRCGAKGCVNFAQLR